MEEQANVDQTNEYWYKQPDLVENLFYGVFEGGGAKGVAYSGALKAMKKNKCWFKGVAGASAGAITASLIAAGFDPADMANETERALEGVQTGFWSGLVRLKKNSGFLRSDRLREWVDELLMKQLKKKFSQWQKANITFIELFNATEIELNIIGTDLSIKRQVIFSHLDTPDCAVADAVVASSSIPFAFTSRLLKVPKNTGEKKYYHHTIVDGGVWSNFPLFIFSDSTFRKDYKRHPEEINQKYVIGFILKEAEEPEVPRGEEIKFERGVSPTNFRAREWLQDDESQQSASDRFWRRFSAVVLYPFAMLGRFAEWKSGVGPGRWPKPRSRLARYIVDAISGLLARMDSMLFGLLAWIVVLVGAVNVFGWLTDRMRNFILASDWTDLISYIGPSFIVIVILLIYAAVVLVVFASLLVITANFLLHRAARKILYGLVTTYVAGPGAPDWFEKRKNVIALPIPKEVTTLSFEIDPKIQKRLIDDAFEKTDHRLEKILAGLEKA
jgi:predicted acylesterase/phospholipase RssA